MVGSRSACWFVLVASTSCSSTPAPPREPAAPVRSVDAQPSWTLDGTTIDQAVDPCVDFYRHACGGWDRATALKPDQASTSWAEEKLEGTTDELIEEILSASRDDDDDLRKLRAHHQACLATASADPAGERTIEEWLAQLAGVKTRKDVEQQIHRFHRHGIDVFFRYSGQPDPADPTRHRGVLQQGAIALETGVEKVSAESLEALRVHIEQTLTRSGIAPETARRASGEVAKLEAALAKHAASGMADEFALPEHPMRISELRKRAPTIDWGGYYELVGASEAEPIYVNVPEYLEAFDRLLRTTDVPTLSNYLRWKLFTRLGFALPPEYRAPASDDEIARSRRCRQAMIRDLGIELSRQVSQRLLGASGRERASTIAEAVRAQLVDSAKHAAWLTPQGRATTADKLARTRLLLGFPDRWPATLASELSSTDFLDNTLAIRSFDAEREWSRVHRSRDEALWEMRVRPNGFFGMAAARLMIPNGFPDAFSNSMLMVASYLQPPLFDLDAPPEVQYGTFGVTAGHELVHVADTYDFDAQGRQRNIWSEAEIEAYGEQLECVAAQGHAFEVEGRPVGRGHETKYENNADLGGLSVGLRAMLAEVPSPDARGADGLTPRQRFFYAYAQGYCTKMSPAHEREIVEQDWHGHPRFRVNGPLKNMPAFAEAFACPKDAPMRLPPAQRCKIW